MDGFWGPPRPMYLQTYQLPLPIPQATQQPHHVQSQSAQLPHHPQPQRPLTHQLIRDMTLPPPLGVVPPLEVQPEKPFPLLELPNDVLFQIVGELLPYTDKAYAHQPWTDTPAGRDFVPWIVPGTKDSDEGVAQTIPQTDPNRLAILRVNKCLNEVAKRILYRTNVFSILVESKYNQFVRPMPVCFFNRSHYYDVIGNSVNSNKDPRRFKLKMSMYRPLHTKLSIRHLRQVDLEIWVRQSSTKSYIMGWHLGWRGPIDRRIFTRINELVNVLCEAQLTELRAFVKFEMRLEKPEHLKEVRMGFSSYLEDKLKELNVARLTFHGEWLDGWREAFPEQENPPKVPSKKPKKRSGTASTEGTPAPKRGKSKTAESTPTPTSTAKPPSAGGLFGPFRTDGSGQSNENPSGTYEHALQVAPVNGLPPPAGPEDNHYSTSIFSRPATYPNQQA